MVLNNLVKKTKSNIIELIKDNRITEKMIKDYEEMSTRNLHSWLQYSLIKAGLDENLYAVPEIKVYYSEKLIPSKFDMRLKIRPLSSKRVDVAYFDESKLLGIAEIVSLDGAHGCHVSEELCNPGLSLRDSLTYLIENNNDSIEFVIILNVLPRKTNTIPWKTVSSKHDELKKTRNYYKVFNQEWKIFAKDLNKSVKVEMITIISENEIETYPIK